MLRILLAAVLLTAGVFSSAHAETTLCTEIASVPATISTQGVYCLKHDLATAIASGAAITIATNNVTIDCNDFKIGGLAAGVSTNAEGINAGDRVNVTIRHCDIRGFRVGIDIWGSSSSHLIEDNRLDLITERAIYLQGDNLVVRRNRILETGGRPGTPQSTVVLAQGNGELTDNFINGDAPVPSSGTAYAVGIGLLDGPFRIEGNFVTGLVPAGSGTARGIDAGLVIANIRNNTVISNAAVNGTGIIGGGNACGENTSINFSTPSSNCSDAGGNVSK